MVGQHRVRRQHRVVGVRVVVEQQRRVYLDRSVAGRNRQDDAFPHARLLTERGLDVLGVNVLSVGQDDQVLLAPLEEEESVVVQEAEVAGLVPAVLEGCLGGGLVSPVALRDVGSARQHLAVVGYSDLLSVQHAPDRSRPLLIEAVRRDHRGRLGCSVALHDPDSERPPLPLQLGVEVGAAGHEEPDVSAELFVDGAEQQPPHRHGKLRRDSLEQPPLAVLAPRADLPLDAVHEELKRLGHQDDVGDAVRAKRLEDHRRLTADGVDHRGAAAQRHQQTARLLQHVAERHQGQQPVRRPDRNRPDGAQDVGEYVAVGEHHTLWGRRSCRR